MYTICKKNKMINVLCICHLILQLLPIYPILASWVFANHHNPFKLIFLEPQILTSYNIVLFYYFSKVRGIMKCIPFNQCWIIDISKIKLHPLGYVSTGGTTLSSPLSDGDLSSSLSSIYELLSLFSISSPLL